MLNENEAFSELACRYSELLVSSGALPSLLEDLLHRQVNGLRQASDEDENCEGDEHAGIMMLTFLARHHPRAENEVVPEVVTHLPRICRLLGADQVREQEVRVLLQD
jgi:hypothetical protein